MNDEPQETSSEESTEFFIRKTRATRVKGRAKVMWSDESSGDEKNTPVRKYKRYLQNFKDKVPPTEKRKTTRSMTKKKMEKIKKGDI